MQNLIEDEALHPITCLMTLSAREKKILLDERIVLCSAIRKNPQTLKELLGKTFDVKPIINEINEL